MPDKDELRQWALERRGTEAGRAAKSDAIQQRIEQLPAYQEATNVASYVGVKSEVETRDLIGRRLVAHALTSLVYRDGDDLKLAFVRSLDELTEESFGLWEPGPAVRADPDRICHPSSVDLFLVPGVAFDAGGGRLGYGRGYYDRLLSQAKADAVFLGLAFECQVVNLVPTTPRDVAMHMLVTEARVLRTPPSLS